MTVNSPSLGGVMTGMEVQGGAGIVSGLRSRIRVRVVQRIEDVEAAWRLLIRGAAESPGQSYDFIRLWVENRGLPAQAQLYVLGEVDGQVVAILPLHRKRVWGIRVLTWFPGAHAGCYAPIADSERLAALGPEGRRALWRAMIGQLRGADLVYLRSVPAEMDGHGRLHDELGIAIGADTLHRASFSSWAQCDGEQRSRSRRKHDRQQGDRLAALGAVSFEEITDPQEAHPVIDIMFRQRSERFRAQGIRDCFVEDNLTGFYHDLLSAGPEVKVVLHVLRLDGEVVAVRYNVAMGTSMFCLISSMSDCPRIQGGSPGKQCLLRVMQSVFDAGYRVFDMGAGLTDEKRHWCNVQVPLRHHYVSLTPLGAAVLAGHSALQKLRGWAKASPAVKKMVRGLHQSGARLGGRSRSDQL